MFCSNCGKQNPPGSRFCLGCGAPLSERLAAPPGPPLYNNAYQPGPYPSSSRPAKKRSAGVIILVALAAVIIAGVILAVLLSGGRVRTETVLGGAVTLDGVTLDFGSNTVPDGAASVSNVTFGKNDAPQGLVSTQLALRCDADHLNEPVSVVFQLPDEAAQGAEDILLGVGLDYTGKYGSAGTYLAFVPATVKDGSAYAEFIPAECLMLLDTVKAAGGTVTIPADMIIKLGWYAYNSYTLKQSKVHFELYVPLDINAGKRERYQLQLTDIKAILDDLESAYSFYKSKGFAYTGRQNWPIDVYISDDMGAAEEGLFSMPWYSHSPDSGTLYFNANLFDWGYPDGGIKQLIYHEFFHFVQQNYVTAENYSPWLDEATATYYESTPYGKSPMIIADYRYNLLQSIYPDDAAGPEGYARAPLIWYLAERYGEDIVLSLYKYGSQTSGLTASPENWLQELTLLTDEPVHYATDFYKTLLTDGFGTKQNYFGAEGIYRYVEKSPWRDTELNPLAGGAPLEVYLPDKDALASLLQQGQTQTLVGQATLRIHTAGAQFAPLVFRELYDTVRDGMDPVITLDNSNCEMTMFYIDQTEPGAYKVMESVTSRTIRLTDFKNTVINGKDPLFLVMITGLQPETWTDCTVSVTASLSPDMLPDVSPGTTAHDGPNGDMTVSPSVSASSPAATAAEDPCADAPAEVAGVQMDRFYDPTPNARSGSISQTPDMRIEAFNIIGGRLIEPDISNNVNETFTYMNNGYCTAGETVGLQMIASARDREHDSIEYNILENRLTTTLRFYDKEGHIIGSPIEQASPEDGKAHTIGDTITAVVPENAASVNIMGYFNHRYGAYGDYHTASVGIDITLIVTDYDVNASAVQTDMIDTSAADAAADHSGDDEDNADSEQFWNSMRGVWMCYNAEGEVEYFIFTGNGGEKALTVGTVETGRSEPSQAIAVTKYDETTYTVIYRFEGADYALYFETSSLDDGTIYYAAYNPAGYRAFDYTGSNLSEAMDYYYTYYAAG